MEPYNRYTEDYPLLSLTVRNVPANPHIDQKSSVKSVSSLAGFKNPKWKEQVWSHQSATTPCSGTIQGCIPGYFESRNVWSAYGVSSRDNRASGSLFAPGAAYPAIPAVPQSLDNAALTRFYNSCTSQYETVNGGVILGELHKTLQQLKHPFRSLVGLAKKRESKLANSKAFKDGRINQFLDAAADTWLETNLALQPLASDISSILERMLTMQFDYLTDTLPVRGVAVIRSKTNKSLFSSWSGSECEWEICETVESVQKVRYKGQILMEHTSFENLGFDHNKVGRLGLSLRDFGPTLWEITPWSFLVDYFANVGDWINSFNVPLSRIAWYNKTIRSEVIITRFYTGRYRNTLPPGVNQKVATMNQVQAGSMKVASFQRSGGPGVTLPRPTIVLDVPGVKQMVTILALAKSQSKGLFSY